MTSFKVLLLAAWLFASSILSAANPGLAIRTDADPNQLRREYRDVTTKIIVEYLDFGRTSQDSIQAYQLLVGLAKQHGVVLTSRPLRTIDERNLGPALLINRLETLKLDYDTIYGLNLRTRSTRPTAFSP